MLSTLLFTLAQAAATDWTVQVERIMWAQVVMAAVMVVFALAVLAAALAVLLLVRKTLDRIEAAKNQMLPHVTPVLSRAATIADDVGHVTAGFRDNADDVQETVHDLIDRTRGAVDTLEDRVQRFAAVLDAAQTEAETLLMDAAATARGMHTTAQALREGRNTRGRQPRRHDSESTGQ